MSFSQTVLIGRVGKDAEVETVGQTTVAKFSLVTTEVWRDKSGEKKEATEWHNIEVWGKMAEAVGKWIEKGRELCVVGKINYQTWKDREGNAKYRTVIRANDVKFVGSKPAESRKRSDEDEQPRGRSSRFVPDPDPTNGSDFNDDDIPF